MSERTDEVIRRSRAEVEKGPGMIRMSLSVCIDAPVAAVWAQLARLEEITLWSEPVLNARLEGPVARGVGAERVCDLVGNLTTTERWIEWDEGRSFTYEAIGMPLIKRARNHLSVHPVGEQSLLRSEAAVELKGGVFGRLVEPIMGVWIRRVGPNSLAAFKYLVEHGRPFEGKHADLPRLSPAC